MNEIPEYYTILFQAAEQAIQALEQQNYGLAKQILIDGEQAAEAAFVAQDESTGWGHSPTPFWFYIGLISAYSAFSRPTSSLNALMSSSSSLACAWTASQVFLTSYHWALRSSTLMPCCSTQV